MAVRRALVFPGQGSQRVGMGADLVAQWPRVVGDVLEEASEAIRVRLGALMAEGPAETLTRTEFAQPAILAHSVAVLRVLERERGWTPRSLAGRVLGHSLGEYAALVAAGALPFADAIQLVHFRGQAMQRAVAPGVGAMAALVPVSPAVADEISAAAAAATGEVCAVANYNSSKQSVLSGTAGAVDWAIAFARSERRVRRAVRLEVSAPFHCALMAPAADELGTRLAVTTTLTPPALPVVWNVEAAATPKADAAAIREVLTEQVVRPVRWSQSIDACVADGCDEFIEIGFGGVLTGLIRQHNAAVTASSCGTAEELRALLRREDLEG